VLQLNFSTSNLFSWLVLKIQWIFGQYYKNLPKHNYENDRTWNECAFRGLDPLIHTFVFHSLFHSFVYIFLLHFLILLFFIVFHSFITHFFKEGERWKEKIQFLHLVVFGESIIKFVTVLAKISLTNIFVFF
jgi:hypothetical protein